MFSKKDLRVRHRQPEIMDQPDLDEATHLHALRGLERINRFSGSSRVLWDPILEFAQRSAGRPFKILDVGTGAGDLPLQLWEKAKRADVAVRLAACDISPKALAFARSRAAAARADIDFFECDVLKDTLPAGYDVVISSLFLHHLDEADVVGLLDRMATAAGQMVLINDLVRSPLNFALVTMACYVFSRSAVVHVDGPRSVEGAFTLEEMRELAQHAGLDGATVSARWPSRMLVQWQRPLFKL